MASSVARGNPRRLARQAVDGVLQTNAFECGRCNRPGKSSCPPLFKSSLKVKRNIAHGQNSGGRPGLRTPNALWSLIGPPQAAGRSGQTFIGYKIGRLRNLHRPACDTQASLFCESEPPLRVAHMPPPKSSVARLSPSIILVNSKLRVRVAGVWPPAPIGS
jgi:hypothetical protein